MIVQLLFETQHNSNTGNSVAQLRREWNHPNLPINCLGNLDTPA